MQTRRRAVVELKFLVWLTTWFMVMVTGHRSQVGFVDHKRSFNFWLSPKLLPNMGNDCQRAWNQTLKFSFQNGFHRRRMSRNWNFGSWYLGMESLLTTLTWLFQMFSMMAMPEIGFIFYAGIPLIILINTTKKNMPTLRE